MLRHQFLHIPHTTKSDPSTLPSESSIPLKSDEEERSNPLKTSMLSKKLPHDNDNDLSSSSNSSSSSSGSSDSDNDMTNKLRQLLKLRTKPKSKKSSRHKSKRHLEKKAISLATKMIKQASHVNFHKLKLDNDPHSTRLIFMYFIKDLTNLLDIFHETYQILSNYSIIQEPQSKHTNAKKSFFTLINLYSNLEVKQIIKSTHGNGCQAIILLQARCA